jgi:DNA helicase-2/ATP-dependent DNA helicase PcrA
MAGAYFCTPQKGKHMQQTKLPEHPAAQEEYLHLQQVRDAIDREIAEVEALTGAKAGVVMDVQMKEDPDQQEEVTIQLFRGKLDRLRQLNMARGQAYFARLDFIPEGCRDETWYLGRWGVLNPVTLDPVVVDWRSPVANLYYSGQVGPMDYSAPDGQIRGELTLKRMLTVHDRELEALFDTGIVSQEAYLQEVLGSISSDRLKDIVTTIQAEQNIVIRYPLSDNLLVQGAAGSGKTTIALHRIAYLLYAFRENLKPENMMILAPNPLFLSYISQVLPDLGVERVIQTTFEGWCREGMGKRMPRVNREGRLEKNLRSTAEERERTGRQIRRKGSLRMLEQLTEYLDGLQYSMIPENGFRMAGVTLMDRTELEDVFLRQFIHYPLETRISELKKMLRKRVQSAVSMLRDRYGDMAEQQVGRLRSAMRDGPERQRRIREIYTARDQRYREIDERAETYMAGYRDKFPALDVMGVYVDFLHANGEDELIPEEGGVRQEDLPLLAVICRAVFGLKTKPMRHIVIDECQDFSPLQIELLRQANPAATFTLVGDLYQGIRADEGSRGWDEWTGPVFHGSAELTQLTVSYRNTVEIMNLAQQVAGRYPIPGIRETRPVLRHGEAPVITAAADEKERLRMIREQVEAWKKEGFHSIALIEKTAEQAKKLYKAIGTELDAKLLTENDREYHGGVMILSAGMVKGMEFDCVGICDASAANFPEDEWISRILYVMMTRPLHRLHIWHRGEMSRLLAEAAE